MDYIEVVCSLKPYSEAMAEICCAKMGEIGFESFVETETGVKAYIPKPDFGEENLKLIFDDLHELQISFSYTIHEIPEQNWNAQWESNFNPVIIAEECIIKAPFHPIEKKYPYEIVIEPKMSFGTGHHETTHLMVEFMLATEFQHKTVLDMGCGTAVLAILASMKEAEKITAIDIEEWAFKNSLENVERNNCENIDVLRGDVQLINDKQYDVILANINRNILLNDIEKYANCLPENGLLFLSGFLSQDKETIKERCLQHNLSFESEKQKNNWIAAKYLKTV